VPLPDGPVTVLPISDAEAVGHPKQPSDVAIGPDGAFYIIDFERRNVVRSPDGATGRAFRGVGGTGTQVPHLAVFGSLVLVTDPVNQRIVVYDTAGKQRGVYIFPSKTNGTRPIGIAVAPDGTIYVADQSGTVLSLKLTIPPATAADIAGLP
jgi:DNA-binding beta-propeller fold protein YncE